MERKYNFGWWIKNGRLEKGLTQKRLTEMLQENVPISICRLSYIENGVTVPTAYEVVELMKILDLTWEETSKYLKLDMPLPKRKSKTDIHRMREKAEVERKIAELKEQMKEK